MSGKKPSESNLPLMLDHFGNPFSEGSVITPSSPSSIGEVITDTPIRPSQPSRKRKKESQTSALTKSIEECYLMLKKTIEDENDENSLLLELNLNNGELPKKKKRLAKITISQLLYNMQYGDEK